jgi:hypothetical protein
MEQKLEEREWRAEVSLPRRSDGMAASVQYPLGFGLTLVQSGYLILSYHCNALPNLVGQ